MTGTIDSAGGYDLTVEEGGPGGEIYNFNNGTGLTEASENPPPVCIFQPCNVSAPEYATLAPSGDPASGIIDFGFEDSGETFSASGVDFLEPTQVLASSVPEPSTWAMMILGFAGLGFAGYRRAKSGTAAVASAE